MLSGDFDCLEEESALIVEPALVGARTITFSVIGSLRICDIFVTESWSLIIYLDGRRYKDMYNGLRLRVSAKFTQYCVLQTGYAGNAVQYQADLRFTVAIYILNLDIYVHVLSSVTAQPICKIR